MAARLSSPVATGGAGVEFEYRLGAIMLSRLLRGAHLPVGAALPVASVAFQQHNAGFLFDDLVAYADPVGNAPHLQIQVKSRMQVTGRDPELIELMRTALQVCREQAEEVARGQLLMVLAAGAPSDGLGDLADLTSMARAHPDADGFLALLRPGVTKSSRRNRYTHVATAVAAADADGQLGADYHEIRHESRIADLTHRVLAGLHVWQVLPLPGCRDWTLALDGLADLAAEAGKSPVDLMGYLYDIAQELGPRSGQIDAARLRAAVRRRFGVDLDTPIEGDQGRPSQINVVNNGSGAVFAAESQVFHGLRIGP